MQGTKEKGATKPSKGHATNAPKTDPGADVQSNKAHFRVFRFRNSNRNSPDFYDPNADFRYVFPVVYRAVLTTLNSVLIEEDTADAVAMVEDIGVLAKIRLVEEPVTIDRVLHMFEAEFRKISPRVRDTFCRLFFLYSMAAYAMLLRREANNDKNVARELFEVVEGQGLLSMLPDDLTKAVLKHIHTYRPELHKDITIAESKDTVTLGMETPEGVEIIDIGAKEMANSLLPASKPMTWDEKAALLDQMAGACAETDPKRSEVLRNIYPHYHEKDSPEWKRDLIESLKKSSQEKSQ